MLRRIVYAHLFVLGFGLFTAFAGETQAPITVWHVLGLTRTMTGVYADRATLLDYLRELKNDKPKKTAGPVLDWPSRLNFSSDEILPGWFMDYEVKPGNTGYILILTGERAENRERRKAQMRRGHRRASSELSGHTVRD